MRNKTSDKLGKFFSRKHQHALHSEGKHPPPSKGDSGAAYPLFLSERVPGHGKHPHPSKGDSDASCPVFLSKRDFRSADHTKSEGYTLIELIAVIAVIALTMFFVIPRFQETMTGNQTQKAARWIMFKVQTLKENAVRKQIRHTLHINLDSGGLWIGNESMKEEALSDAEEKGHEFAETIRVTDVEYPIQGKVEAGTADICFYKNGYSDKVLIHMEDDDNRQFTFLIEPFLSKVKMYDEYVEFER